MTRSIFHRGSIRACDFGKKSKISFVILIATFIVFTTWLYKYNQKQADQSAKNPLAHGLDYRSEIKRGKTPNPKKKQKYRFSIPFAKKHRVLKEPFLQNITKDLLTNTLFTNVQDDPYILRHDQYFKPKSLVNNGLHHKFILNGMRVCKKKKKEKKKSPDLLIIFPSSLKDFAYRQAIRKTWMDAAQSNQWPERRINESVRHLFFLGLKTTGRDKSFRRVEQESEVFGDIVLADFIDSYSNLSRKMVTALQWVDKYCPGVRYVLKCDQDTFVNVPLLLRFLSEVDTEFEKRNFVMGRTHFAQPEVQRKGRWATSIEDYPLQYFPSYAYGHSYIIGGGAVRALLSAANSVPLISSEDVFITGILPKVTGVARIQAGCFTVCCRDIFDCEIVLNQFVSMTALHQARDHYRLWRSVQSHTCHPHRAFNFRHRRKRKILN